MTNRDSEFQTCDLSPEALGQFALIEEIRLIASKMDRLYQEISSKIPLAEEMEARIKTLDKALLKIKEIRAEIRAQARGDGKMYKRGEYKCRKKELDSNKSTDACTKSNCTSEDKPSFLKSWWHWPENPN